MDINPTLPDAEAPSLPATIQGAGSEALGHPHELLAVVVTSASEIFTGAMRRSFGSAVLVCDNRAEALAALRTHACTRLFVDLAEFGPVDSGRWTGFRLLRHVRDSADLVGVAVWLMTAERSYSHTDWVIGLGAAGVVARSAAEVTRRIRDGQEQAESPSVQGTVSPDLRRVEQVFRRLAPDGGHVTVMLMRRAAAEGRVGSSAVEYAQALAASLTVEDVRNAILREAGAAGPANTAGPVAAVAEGTRNATAA